jgi:hypothetical protein
MTGCPFHTWLPISPDDCDGHARFSGTEGFAARTQPACPKVRAATMLETLGRVREGTLFIRYRRGGIRLRLAPTPLSFQAGNPPLANSRYRLYQL